jgi:protein-S-isoprenylcysteine O-methyltransferase Ste14
VPRSGPGLGRQLLAVGLLPAIATIAAPALLVYLYGLEVGWGLPGAAAALSVALGLAVLLAGLRLVHQTISLFGRVGEGTLAPWDPTRRLVVEGPYRRVRNPMITGVALVLLGEAAVLGSPAILAELAVFTAANALWMPLVEEPGLVRRFGSEYDEYRRAVPRWVPRRKPWTG